MSPSAVSGLAELLAAGDAPAALAASVSDVLGEPAAEVLRADPWRLLDVRAVRPEQADSFARRLLGTTATGDDPRRAAALVAWHLRRAAADGHTAVPAALVRAALGGHGVSDPGTGVEHACRAGRAVLAARPSADDPDRVEELVADAGLAGAEDDLAEALLRLDATAEPLPTDALAGAGPAAAELAERGVLVVDNPYEAGAATALNRLRGLPWVRLVEHAELLGVPSAAELVAAVPEGARLVLAGDPALLPGEGPGAVLADAAASGALPAVTLPPAPSPVADLVASVRAGRLPAVDDASRRVVVLPSTDAAAVPLAVRVVAESVPRVHGIEPPDVAVVTPLRGGVAGASALDRALTERLGPHERPRASTVHEARGRRRSAVVVVLPAEAAGRLSRTLVATACALAEVHVTVVAAAGPALREAVERDPVRTRSTRLAGLLRFG